ncbi:MAG: DUF5320 domain-containing protein [Desulfobacteraceae bacterium]|nr:DUF5320 domain-containing protein [Desulfobacteraceae bacterium]MBC2720175.1 DUF5320 domain-containing protein [Desulfobacteraceae bacterium]
MPGFDRTGPMGAGSMTGGARGLCNSANAEYNPRFTEGFSYGRGLGLRRGFRGGFGPDRGLGRGYGWYPPAVGPAYPARASDEIDMLQADANYMQKSLDAINKRIGELEKKPSASS